MNHHALIFLFKGCLGLNGEEVDLFLDSTLELDHLKLVILLLLDALLHDFTHSPLLLHIPSLDR